MSDPVLRPFQNYGDSAEIEKILVDPSEPLSSDNQLVTKSQLLALAGGDLTSDGEVKMVPGYVPDVPQAIATKDIVDEVPRNEIEVEVTGDYTVTSSDFGKVLRCIGDDQTTTIFISSSLAIRKTFSIVHEGGSNLKINIQGLGNTKINGVAEIVDTLRYANGLYVVHSNKHTSDSWSAVGGIDEIVTSAVENSEGVLYEGDSPYTLSEDDFGKTLRVGGNSYTFEFWVPDGLREKGKLYIINQGGFFLKIDVEHKGSGKINGQTKRANIIQLDQRAYVSHLSGGEDYHVANGVTSNDPTFYQ